MSHASRESHDSPEFPSHGEPSDLDETVESLDPLDRVEPADPLDALPPGDLLDPLDTVDPLDAVDPLDVVDPLDMVDLHTVDPLDAVDPLDPVGQVVPLDPLGPSEAVEHLLSIEEGQSFRELRPQWRLRVWQVAPIIALAVGGSLMFAFPLAFESGDAGPVVAMLGLLLCCCAAGWGLMAARRVGQTWPGLPARGSGGRPDWRYVSGYVLAVALVAILAVWRIARLR